MKQVILRGKIIFVFFANPNYIDEQTKREKDDNRWIHIINNFSLAIVQEEPWTWRGNRVAVTWIIYNPPKRNHACVYKNYLRS